MTNGLSSISRVSNVTTCGVSNPGGAGANAGSVLIASQHRLCVYCNRGVEPSPLGGDWSPLSLSYSFCIVCPLLAFYHIASKSNTCAFFPGACCSRVEPRLVYWQ